jgi:hypothetical protein
MGWKLPGKHCRTTCKSTPYNLRQVSKSKSPAKARAYKDGKDARKM